MSSKQLDSILKKLPSATAQEKNKETETNNNFSKHEITEETDRVVAVIPKALKRQIKQRIEENKGETEKSIILKGLKAIGFNIKEEWLIDKRSLR